MHECMDQWTNGSEGEESGFMFSIFMGWMTKFCRRNANVLTSRHCFCKCKIEWHPMSTTIVFHFLLLKNWLFVNIKYVFIEISVYHTKKKLLKGKERIKQFQLPWWFLKAVVSFLYRNTNAEIWCIWMTCSKAEYFSFHVVFTNV